MYLAHLGICKRKASEFLPFQQKAFNQAHCLDKHEFLEVNLSKLANVFPTLCSDAMLWENASLL